MISSFLEHQPVEEIVKIAQKYYSPRYIQAAADYIELIQMRPDIHFTDETKQQLLRLLKGKQRGKFRKRLRAEIPFILSRRYMRTAIVCTFNMCSGNGNVRYEKKN